MGIKNAGKAKIKKNLGKAPTKETVDTPISECEAENPLECRFHGLKALDQQLSVVLPSLGYKIPFGTDKLQGGKGYEIRLDGKVDVEKSGLIDSLMIAFKKQGWDLTYNGKVEGAGHSFYLKKGKEDESVAEETDEDKADIVDSSKSPSDDDEDILDNDDLAEFNNLLMEAESEEPSLPSKDIFKDIDNTGLTDEEVKDFLAKNHLTEETKHGDTPFDEVVANWKGLIEDGVAPNGAKLEEQDVSLLTGFYDAAGPDNKVAQALWAKMVQKGMVEEKPSANDSDFDMMNYIGSPEKLKEDLGEEIPMGDFDSLLEEDMSDFDALLEEAEGETGAEEVATEEFTDAELKKFLAKGKYEELAKLPSTLGLMKEAILKGTMEGQPLPEITKDAMKNLIAANGENHKISKLCKKWLDTDSNAEPTDADWDEAVNIVKESDGFMHSDFAMVEDENALKKMLQTAGWCWSEDDSVVEFIDDNQALFKGFIKSIASVQGNDSPVVKAMLKAYKGYSDYDMYGLEGLENNAKAEVTKESEAKSETPATIMGTLDESLMKPLEHDESKFPPSLTKKDLEDAIAKGKSAGGHGGLHTTIVEIGGKKYVCKNGAGKKSHIIKNGYNADMAYRAGGIYAPDAKLYEFGDGKTYKLSEFIEGKRLIDVWKTADEARRDSIRKELLQGYPLDALFSNYDVLGTSPEESQSVTIMGADGKPQKTHVAFDNIMIGSDGHAYRIDNDGAFAMTGTGGHKSSGGAAYTAPVEAEQWDNWDERQWIDDFRTMRRNEKNLGIFDRYSTADIFLSAGNINLDNVVSSLPEQIQKALAKPLFEMKQMTYRAVNISLGGFKNNGFVSMALDASYEASKRGLREQCQLAVSWNNSGFGKYKEHWGNYQPQPFGEKPPEPPQDPTQVLESKLKNEEYTGNKIGSIILNAAKTINHHGGVKQIDKNGNVLGNGTAMSTPDYDPNAAKIAEWEKIDREKLKELAKTDENAKTLLGLYDTIAYSKENGWKKPIGQIPTGLVISAKLDSDFKSQTEKKVLEDMAGAIKEFEAKQKQYQKELIAYEQKKSEHKKKEEAKALAAGGSPYHNFHHFAEALMEEGINTDGIAHQVKTNGIAPIESSMQSQKGSSYASDAVKWKVREMMALGYTPEQILKMSEEGKLYNGSFYTSCINNSLIPNKENWDRDMNSQAMYLGMNMVKMENEQSDLYDKASGVVFLNRNISNTPKGLTKAEEKIYNSSETGWVGPHVDSAADCMQFEKNSWGGSKKQVYAVPFSRIVCCANNDTSTGTHQDYGYGENEYVGNLFQLPCWVYHPSNNLTWKNAIDEAKENNGMSGLLKKFASRLGLFNTLIKNKK